MTPSDIGKVLIVMILIGMSTLYLGHTFGMKQGFAKGYATAMQEGFDLGKTVQCKGLPGYYWDCKDALQ